MKKTATKTTKTTVQKTISDIDLANSVLRLEELIGNKTGFASFTIRNSSGEVSRHTVIIGPKYENVLRNSIQKLEVDRQFEDDWDQEIVDVILESMNKSLRGENELANKQADNYVFIGDNIKISKNNGAVLVSALSHKKVVLEEGEGYAKVNSRPATIERRKIEATLPKGKWRTFKLQPETVFKFNGDAIIF